MNPEKAKQTFKALGLRERPSQLDMMQAISNAIQHRNILCVEAPTGVGKTLAYLIAALENKTNDETIIVSTATIALQSQILNNDIPLVEKILGRKVKASIAKGRRRYVCHSRLYEPENYYEDEAKGLFTIPLQEALEKNTWDGERDHASIPIRDAEWHKISTDSSGCHAAKCAYFDDCKFFQARKRVEIADVVITNHSLLLSDLSLGGGVVLPEPENCIYILDECHQLAEIAVNAFAEQAAVMRSTEWINTLTKALKSASMLLNLNDDYKNNATTNAAELVKALTQTHQFIQGEHYVFDEDLYRVETVDPVFVELIKTIIAFADRIIQTCENLLEKLNDQYELISKNDKDSLAAIESAITSFQFVLSRAEGLASTWQLFLQEKDELGVPVARWLEKKQMKPSDDLTTDYTAHASPIAASRKLKELFWDKVSNSIIMCSATVRALGEFKNFERRMGLANNTRFKSLALPSSFDFTKSTFFIPAMKFTPQDGTNHIDETADLLPFLISKEEGGTLVLFTSKKAMREVFELLPESIQDDVLMQGERGKMKLIELHKEKIDNKKQSIIFGLASFAEGLDLPGDYCKHVIIHKLPFAVPSEPVEITRSEWLKKNDRNPFMMISLPQASVKLTQYVGRLIRTESDTGIVTVLDKRLITKFYGKQLLSSLPPFKKIIDKPVDALTVLVSD